MQILCVNRRHSFITAMPVLGLFALGQRRFPAAVAATTHIILLWALIVPKRPRKLVDFLCGKERYSSSVAMGRMLANEVCYLSFLLYISWKREMVSVLLCNWRLRFYLFIDRPRPFHHEQADQGRVLISPPLANEGEANPDFKATVDRVHIPRSSGAT